MAGPNIEGGSLAFPQRPLPLKGGGREGVGEFPSLPELDSGSSGFKAN
jgi:hypothetical protein